MEASFHASGWSAEGVAHRAKQAAGLRNVGSGSEAVHQAQDKHSSEESALVHAQNAAGVGDAHPAVGVTVKPHAFASGPDEAQPVTHYPTISYDRAMVLAVEAILRTSLFN
jgi:hypothetical protein